MGIIDIFYNEFNRWRDEKKERNEIKLGVNNALRKSLIKLEFIWDDMILTGAYSIDEKMYFLSNISEELMNIAVELNDFLDKEIIDKLREISVDLKRLSRIPKTMTVSKRIQEEGEKILKKVNDLKDKVGKD